MIALLTAAIGIALWQASEVVARIQQLMWFQKKFSGYEDEIISITAGTTATMLFVVGTLIGVVICQVGIRKASDLKSSFWKPPFWLAMFSTIVFGVGWVVLIMSPYVDLHAR